MDEDAIPYYRPTPYWKRSMKPALKGIGQREGQRARRKAIHISVATRMAVRFAERMVK